MSFEVIYFNFMNTPRGRRLSIILGIALSIICAVMLIWLLLVLFKSPANIQLTEIDITAEAIGKEAEAVNLSQLHLFGEAPISADDTDEVPDSTLNLTLAGIMFSPTAEDSHALIIDSTGSNHMYFEGDELPGGTIIHKIYQNNVILRRDGRYEKLELPRNPMTFGPAPKALP